MGWCDFQGRKWINGKWQSAGTCKTSKKPIWTACAENLECTLLFVFLTQHWIFWIVFFCKYCLESQIDPQPLLTTGFQFNKYWERSVSSLKCCKNSEWISESQKEYMTLLFSNVSNVPYPIRNGFDGMTTGVGAFGYHPYPWHHNEWPATTIGCCPKANPQCSN